MDTLGSIAGLFGFDKDRPLLPPRFAKVVTVGADTVGVTVGESTVEAVRCCACAVDDVVLVETMPNGTLAAVATRGASGGSSGVQSVTIGTVSGATFANSGTADNVVLDLDVDAPEYGASGIWAWHKWPDGTAQCWGYTTWSITSWSAWGNMYYSNPIASQPYPVGLFLDPPIEIAKVSASGLDTIQYTRGGTASKDNTRSYALIRPATGSSTTGQLYVFAIGRWK